MKTGLWKPGGPPSPEPLRSMRQRYYGAGTCLVVEKHYDEDGELVYEPVRVIHGRGGLEVRFGDAPDST